MTFDTFLTVNNIQLILKHPKKASNIGEQPIQPSTNDKKLPEIFSLRLPVTLLSKLDNNYDMRFELNKQDANKKSHENVQEEWKLTIQSPQKEMDGTKKSLIKVMESHALISLNSSQMNSHSMDVFECTPSKDKEIYDHRKKYNQYEKKTMKHLYYTGTITKKFMISSKQYHLEHLRRKTRQISQMEKWNRKEIVCLDQNDSILLQNKTKSLVGFADAIKEVHSKTSKNVTMKRKAKQLLMGEPAQKRKKASYMEASSLSLSPQPPQPPQPPQNTIKEENRSNIVRLHGLPIGCKPDHIRLFFKGLDPQRIFILPYYDHVILNLDVNKDGHPYPRQKWKIPKNYCSANREDETIIRAFVKFRSIPLADLAVARSGESIQITAGTGTGTRTSTSTSSVMIGITSVPRDVAAFFLKYMALDGIKGESLNTTLFRMHQNIYCNVEEIIWNLAMNKLNMRLQKNDANELYHLFSTLNSSLSSSSSSSSSSNQTSYSNLSKLHNSLQDLFDRISIKTTLSTTFMQMQTNGIDHLHIQPIQQNAKYLETLNIQRLITAVKDGLYHEMEKIDFRLKRMRSLFRSSCDS